MYLLARDPIASLLQFRSLVFLPPPAFAGDKTRALVKMSQLVTRRRTRTRLEFETPSAGRLTFFFSLFQKSSSRGAATFHADSFCRAGERCARRESLRSMIAPNKVATAVNFTRNSRGRRA